jgi:hypothetical protein
MRDLCTFGFSSTTLAAGDAEVSASASADAAFAADDDSREPGASGFGRMARVAALLGFFAAVGGDCREKGDIRFERLDKLGELAYGMYEVEPNSP